MAPSATEQPWTSPAYKAEKYDGPPRNIQYIDGIQFDPKLQPKSYEIHGTHPESKILFTDVHILDATGKLPYKGDVLIEGRLMPEHNEQG